MVTSLKLYNFMRC